MIANGYYVQPVSVDMIPRLVTFIQEERKILFPMLNHDQLPADIRELQRVYLDPEDTNFFVACSLEGEVIGSLGVIRFQDRYEELKGVYDPNHTAEIQKCYVDQRYRRQGIGAALFREAKNFCQQMGYTTLYLHTHPFLPGALVFWQHHGFSVRKVVTGKMETIHMDLQTTLNR